MGVETVPTTGTGPAVAATVVPEEASVGQLAGHPSERAGPVHRPVHEHEERTITVLALDHGQPVPFLSPFARAHAPTVGGTARTYDPPPWNSG